MAWKQHHRLSIWPMLWLLVLVISALFFMITDPSKLAPPLVITAFVLIFGLLYGVCISIYMLVGRSQKVSRVASTTAGAIAGLPTLLIALQSIGQLTISDILTLCALAAIGGFYLHRFPLGHRL